jgi:hypothetical protein
MLSEWMILTKEDPQRVLDSPQAPDPSSGRVCAPQENLAGTMYLIMTILWSGLITNLLYSTVCW